MKTFCATWDQIDPLCDSVNRGLTLVRLAALSAMHVRVYSCKYVYMIFMHLNIVPFMQDQINKT